MPTAGVESGAIDRASEMSSDLRIAAIVVSYDSTDQLSSCLASLRDSSHTISCLVVDNSPDHHTYGLRAAWPEVEFVYPMRNLGFGAGVNFGIARVPAEADAILVV